MGEEHSVKNLVSRTASDPWAVFGRRPWLYQIPEVGDTLIDTVDGAVFERKIEKAIVTGVILEKWAETQHHFACKAPAVMSTVYCISNMTTIAEEKLANAMANIRNCKDCRAHYLKRNGIFFLYSRRLTEAVEAYTEAMSLFKKLGENLEYAKCLVNRGVAKSVMKEFEGGLADAEAAMEIFRKHPGRYVVVGAVNKAAILTKMGRSDEAREKVAEAQELFAGIKNLEHPKLILRWIKALLLEENGNHHDRKLAAQMMDRVEARMKTLDMQAEIRVLLADRARIARSPHLIKQIATKALAMEHSSEIRLLIQNVINDPTRKNILNWRNALDTYVPPFTETA